MTKSKPTVTAVIATLVIFGALGIIWLSSRSTGAKYDSAPIRGMAIGMGEVLAGEVIQAIHDKGQVVVVTDTYRAKVTSSGGDYCWDTFTGELKKYPAVSVVTEKVEPQPGESPWNCCSVSAFEDVLRRHGNAEAIVFFIDLPPWTKVESIIPTGLKTRIIVVDPGNNMQYPVKLRYRDHFAANFLSILISQKKSPSTSASPAKTPREWFDRQYQVYTIRDLDGLPDFGANAAAGSRPAGPP